MIWIPTSWRSGAQQLGLTTLRIDEVEAAKASANKEWKEELSGLREDTRKLSRALQSRKELRAVVCLVQYHSPVQATKRLIRKDTGEHFRDEPMDGQECQANLFEPDLQDLADRVKQHGLEEVVLGAIDANAKADELYDDAVKLCFEFGKASTSMLRRRLRIGYGRAASLIEKMYADGLVGPADGSKPRELLKDKPPGVELQKPNGFD